MIRKILAVLTLGLICLGSLGAQGMELNPAYVSGSYVPSSGTYAEKISSVSIYASSGSYTSSTSVNSSGAFTLTLNAPADGTERTYNIQANVYLKNGFYANLPVKTVTVKKDQVITGFNSEIPLAQWTVNFSANATMSATYLYFNGYSNYKAASGTTQTHTVDVVAGTASSLYVYAYPSDTTKWTTYYKYYNSVTFTKGETKTYNESFTFPAYVPPAVPDKGTFKTNIELKNVPQGWYVDYIYSNNPYYYLYNNGSTSSPSINPSTQTVETNVGTYYRTYLESRIRLSGKNAYQYFRWPYSMIGGTPTSYGYNQVTITKGQTTEVDDVATFVNQRINFNLSGVASNSDLNSNTTIYFYPYSATGGSSNPANGAYVQVPIQGQTMNAMDVAFFPGTYRLQPQLYLTKNTNTVMDYVQENLYISYTGADKLITLTEGQTAQEKVYDIPMGSVKIKFAVSDGTLISQPYLSFSFVKRDGTSTVYNGSGSSYGSSSPVTESQATIIGPEGEYTINARATVNGSTVTFNPKTVVVIEGVDQVLEINGPSLAVLTPSAGSYTFEDETSVSGIATGDGKIASVKVNGQDVTFTSTNNVSMPNQVQFSTTLPLVSGPNKITVLVTDVNGKIAQDIRYVYMDAAAPTLSFTPATGSTSAGFVTVEGTASDDNQITKVMVNGVEVSFISINDPKEPHKVSFSRDVNLNEGQNLITVMVTDNSKRTTSETHVITKENRDLKAPVFTQASEGTLPGLTLEQAGPEGTAYTLDTPSVTDDRDASPVVTSDAPAIFPAGETVVTWTAADAAGNTATVSQTVTVVDTVAPAISAPAALILEQAAAEGTEYILTSPEVTDAVDGAPVLTSDAPAIFPAGETVVTWTAVDAAGNTSTATQTVTVADTTAPVIEVPAAVTLEQASAEGTGYVLEVPAAADAVDASPTVTSDAPSVFPAGVTVVTWTAVDASGNTSEAVQTVTVADTTAPAMTAPAAVTLEQASAEGTAYVLDTPAAVDAVDAAPAVTSDAPAIFPAGETVVTWTAVDAAGNASAVTQTVTVSDTVAPVLAVPAAVILEQAAPAGTAYVLEVPAATDAVDAAPGVTSDAPAVFPAGETVVTWTAVDAAGNSASVTQTVTVVDTTAPVFVSLPEIILEAAGSNGTAKVLAAPAVTDAADPKPVVTGNAPALFPIGTTYVTWTAVDSSGNAVTGVQTVKVVDSKGPALSVCVSSTNLRPGHHMVPVLVGFSARDAVDGNLTRKVELVSVTSDEAADSNLSSPGRRDRGDDGHTNIDVVIISEHLILLRAERANSGDGRVYTLTYKVTDSAGNTTTVKRIVEVRKDPRTPAVDSGVAYTVTPQDKFFKARGR